MNKLVLVCATLMAFVTAGVACDGIDTSCAVVKASDGFLNLRTAPTTQSNILMPVKNGISVEFSETLNGWVLVHNVGGNEIQGWMSKSSLKIYQCH
jgi:uncharacterized protein YgiM (DUF1202 family)